MNQSNLRTLLGEFLPEEMVETIATRADELDITVKVRRAKGRWNRETLRKLIKERGDHCSTCNADGSKDKLTLDHIIPKQMLLDMGLDEYYEDESNLEILCRDCNTRKAAQLDFSNPKTIIQLEKYIGLYKQRHAMP
jgi:hypothetical protein